MLALQISGPKVIAWSNKVYNRLITNQSPPRKVEGDAIQLVILAGRAGINASQ